MTLWFAALLGLIQGLTEFIPISSTGHLRIAPTLLGQPDPGAAFTAVLQLGTLLAVFVYFAKDLFVTIPRAVLRDPRSPEGMLPWKLAVGTIPIVVAGIALREPIKTDFRSLYVVAAALIGIGIVMAWVDARAKGRRTMLELGWIDALLIGCAQACALVPGVSRSGSTIVVALLLGASRPEAARFSFLLGIPAIAGAGIFEMKDAIAVVGEDGIAPLAVGLVVAAASGYASIAWLIRFLSTRRLAAFAIYRVLLGAALIALVAGGVVSAYAGS